MKVDPKNFERLVLDLMGTKPRVREAIGKAALAMLLEEKHGIDQLMAKIRGLMKLGNVKVVAAAPVTTKEVAPEIIISRCETFLRLYKAGAKPMHQTRSAKALSMLIGRHKGAGMTMEQRGIMKEARAAAKMVIVGNYGVAPVAVPQEPITHDDASPKFELVDGGKQKAEAA